MQKIYDCMCVYERERKMGARRGMISRKRYTCEIPYFSKQLHNVSQQNYNL